MIPTRNGNCNPISSKTGGLRLFTRAIGFPKMQIHVAVGFMDSKQGNITWIASSYHVINPYQSIISPVRSLAVLYDIGRVSLLDPTRPDGSYTHWNSQVQSDYWIFEFASLVWVGKMMKRDYFTVNVFFVARFDTITQPTSDEKNEWW